MSTDSTCQQLLFGRLGRREVLAEFSGGSLSSDGGALLLRLAEEKTRASWSRARRVVAKAEALVGKANPRFVATSFTKAEVEAWQVYEVEYCPRGEAENRIKEQQLDLFGTRASCSTMAGNQVRLFFSGLAYLLVQAIRALGLKGTDLSRAQAGTIRVKLFKVAAAVKVTARKVWVRLSSYCPFAAAFAEARDNLSACPALVM